MTSSYRPLAVSLGVVAMYLLALVHVSSVLMKRLSKSTWRRLHALSPLLVWCAVLHGALAGTDAANPVYQAIVWLLISVCVAAGLFRVVLGRSADRAASAPAPRRPSRAPGLSSGRAGARRPLVCDDLMTAARVHPVVEPARSPWRHVVGLAVAIGSVASMASTARADQTVFFDEAGDAPHISLIGDSTLTGVRWYADYGALERFNFVFSAESCRRTFEQSCISQEGYRSENVIAAMRTLDGELGEVLVVMSGYNDPARRSTRRSPVSSTRPAAKASATWSG